jgi:hypothetical protein
MNKSMNKLKRLSSIVFVGAMCRTRRSAYRRWSCTKKGNQTTMNEHIAHKCLAAIGLASLLGFACTAPAQTVILSGFNHTHDTPSGRPPGTAVGGTANFSLAYVDGAGPGGSEAVVMTVDFTGNGLGLYSYQNPVVSGNTSANINDYTLSFDAAVNVANAGFGVSVSTYLNDLGPLTGELDSPSEFPISTANTFEHFTLNLGSDFIPGLSHFDPRGTSWVVALYSTSRDFGVPSTGNQVTFANIQVTMVPEPSILALLGLGAVAGLTFLRRAER